MNISHIFIYHWIHLSCAASESEGFRYGDGAQTFKS